MSTLDDLLTHANRILFLEWFVSCECIGLHSCLNMFQLIHDRLPMSLVSVPHLRTLPLYNTFRDGDG